MPKGSHKFTYTYKPTYENTSNRPPPRSGGVGASSSSSATPTASILPLIQDTENFSVSELIQHLRQHQVPVIDEEDGDRQRVRLLAPTATVHPSLQGLLGVDGALPPRPRLPRGFAAPNSWRARPVTGAPGATTAPPFIPKDIPPILQGSGCGSPRDPYNLPGLVKDDTMSLIHILLRSLAKDFTFHVEYDKYYLWDLRPSMKSLLLSYLAVEAAIRREQNVPDAVEKSLGLNGARLRVMFEKTLPDTGFTNEEEQDHDDRDENYLNDGELYGIVGTEDMTHLNLAGALGYGLSFKDLGALFKPDHATPRNTILPTAPVDEEIVDNWEDALEEQADLISTVAIVGTRFPALTHLSLAYPHSSISYTDLLKFCQFIPTITHLALAGWPCSSLAPKNDAWGSLQHSITALRRLSKELLCLQYLDVSDCDTNVYRALEGVEWNGCWRKVTTVVVRQTGHATNNNGKDVLDRRKSAAVALGETIKDVRKGGRGEWCTLVSDS